MVALFEKVMFDQSEVMEVRELAMKTSGRRTLQVEKEELRIQVENVLWWFEEQQGDQGV